jgi:predicted dehydrogenase
MTETLNYANPSEKTQPAIEELHDKLEPLPATRQLGVALLGLGEYSKTQLAPALAQTKFCTLAGIITDDMSKTAEWKTRYQIPDNNIYSYEDFDRITSNNDIDIIFITVPNALHKEYVIRAAKAGKHVICEKPMAITVEECDEMIAACKTANRLLGIGYRLHYEPNNREAARAGQEKIYGDLTYIHVQHGKQGMSGWRFDKKLAGGGALMDLGIYCIQAARYVTGEEPAAVFVTSQQGYDANNPDSVETFLAWEMQMPNGLVVKAETSYETDMDLLNIKGEHGWFELSPAFAYNGIKGKTATGFLKFREVNQQALMLDDFALSVLNDKPASLPGEMGRQDVKIIRAIYESMRTGKRIELDS